MYGRTLFDGRKLNDKRWFTFILQTFLYIWLRTIQHVLLNRPSDSIRSQWSRNQMELLLRERVMLTKETLMGNCENWHVDQANCQDIRHNISCKTSHTRVNWRRLAVWNWHGRNGAPLGRVRLRSAAVSAGSVKSLYFTLSFIIIIIIIIIIL